MLGGLKGVGTCVYLNCGEIWVVVEWQVYRKIASSSFSSFLYILKCVLFAKCLHYYEQTQITAHPNNIFRELLEFWLVWKSYIYI